MAASFAWMKFGDRKRKRRQAFAGERGRELLLAGDQLATLRFLEDAAEEFPEDPEIRVLLASILLAVRPDEVSVEASRAARLGVDDPAIQARAGQLLLGRGEIGEARACARRARELAQPDFILLASLEGLEGQLAALDGNDALAEHLFRSAVARDPDYPNHVVDLAQFLAKRGRTAEAIEAIDGARPLAEWSSELEQLREELEG